MKLSVFRRKVNLLPHEDKAVLKLMVQQRSIEDLEKLEDIAPDDRAMSLIQLAIFARKVQDALNA